MRSSVGEVTGSVNVASVRRGELMLSEVARELLDCPVNRWQSWLDQGLKEYSPGTRKHYVFTDDLFEFVMRFPVNAPRSTDLEGRPPALRMPVD